MKFLVDNALSPLISSELIKLGHDSVHVKEIGLGDADDKVIFDRAFEGDRIIISADTDFGFLLSEWKNEKPSVIIFRKGTDREPLKQIEFLRLYLDKPEICESLIQGSLLIIEATRIRIKSLPIFKK